MQLVDCECHPGFESNESPNYLIGDRIPRFYSHSMSSAEVPERMRNTPTINLELCSDENPIADGNCKPWFNNLKVMVPLQMSSFSSFTL